MGLRMEGQKEDDCMRVTRNVFGDVKWKLNSNFH